ncbi:hypothetical protein QMP26_13015 [Enterocloster clostridioformis]|uniref:hypothetical protein n=1 Tax=Enterocloster clostridioformis TaxID=1531 RepID=UPI001F2C43B6|nr:hypothetical protein [Enterocloster clostridioformis]
MPKSALCDDGTVPCAPVFLSGNTGGAKGIGKCICEEFEEQRAKVCVIDLLDNPSSGWIDVGYY